MLKLTSKLIFDWEKRFCGGEPEINSVKSHNIQFHLGKTEKNEEKNITVS